MDIVQLRDDFFGPTCIFQKHLDIDSMSKFILDVNFCMSVKLDECNVERGCGSCLPSGIELGIGATSIHRALVGGTELLEVVCKRLGYRS